MSYQYTGLNGEFEMKNPEQTSYLYFPLANEAGVMSCVTPDLGGDSKMGQNTFFMPPVSCENLHNDKSSRNFWCRIEGRGAWSLTGRSAGQQSCLFSDQKEETVLSAGFMHQQVRRNLKEAGLAAVIESFVPSSGEKMELTRVTVKNTEKTPQTIQIISAIPIYGRSADNIRDHRHVTALLHRIAAGSCGVTVTPTMSFDERGHKRNHILYGVFGGNREVLPERFCPVLEEFIGEGGSLEMPAAVFGTYPDHRKGETFGGYEALGSLCFPEKTLAPGESISYVFAMAYGEEPEDLERTVRPYLDETVFQEKLEETKNYWKERVNVTCHTGDPSFDRWMKWVGFQPMLRRIYGCSFLPHHDYGKGGRGWRDLWQDCLALLMMNPDGVREMLIQNFGGVRMDGTNATIIGDGLGNFIADRNNITRVWMDHGVWPLLTTDLYIQQTGDIEILLEENSYFKDIQVCRGEEKDRLWEPEQGTKQLDESGKVYRSSLLEHLLVQHLTAFYDVGEHNHIRMRGADWNDALDMAADRGESVAFTFMYAKNLEQIARLLAVLEQRGMYTIPLLKEITGLLCSKSKVYDSVKKKRQILKSYCESCIHGVSGEKVEVNLASLQIDLLEKAAWICNHIRKNEWIDAGKEIGWYNGYYDNSGRPVEGKKGDQVRMMLTGQVFAIMSGIAEQSQIEKIVRAADQYLYDQAVGGYRLNTDFEEVKMDLGRMFGFAYGHKENGAVFSHMTTMFGNALYQRKASAEAYHVIRSLYRHCSDFEKAKIYPGIPEYIDARGRGVYHYLTGAASWMLLTVVTRMFGVRGAMGNLVFDPQLLPEQFDGEGKASLSLVFAGKKIKVEYKNPEGLDPREYRIGEILVNGKDAGEKAIKPGIPAQSIPKTEGETCIAITLRRK